MSTARPTGLRSRAAIIKERGTPLWREREKGTREWEGLENERIAVHRSGARPSSTEFEATPESVAHRGLTGNGDAGDDDAGGQWRRRRRSGLEVDGGRCRGRRHRSGLAIVGGWCRGRRRCNHSFVGAIEFSEDKTKSKRIAQSRRTRQIMRMAKVKNKQGGNGKKEGNYLLEK